MRPTGVEQTITATLVPHGEKLLLKMVIAFKPGASFPVQAADELFDSVQEGQHAANKFLMAAAYVIASEERFRDFLATCKRADH